MSEKKRLKIYYTSDLHGYFYPTVYRDQNAAQLGLFQCAPHFKKDEQTLVIDGGDILQGSAFAYFCRSVKGSAEAIARRMNACGYDYYTLGNHDFNYGQEYLASYREAHRGVCLCQNVTDEKGNTLYPYVIRMMPDGLKVAIVGIVTDHVNVWEKKVNLKGICVTDPFEAAKMALMEVAEEADLTICVYHGGFECDLESGKSTSETTENIGYRICRELSFDILLTGHQHRSVEGRDICGTYVVQPSDNGKEYCVLQADVGEEGVQISSWLCKADLSCGGELREKYRKQEDDVMDWLQQPIGHLSKDLLPEDRVLMALHGSPIADFLNQVQKYYSGAQISVTSLANGIAGFRNPVTTRDVISTYPYADTLVVCQMNGKQLRAAMERSAEYFSCREDGTVEVAKSFLEPKVEHYNYDYYAGVEYRIDPAKPVGARVVLLRMNGCDIRDADMFTVCLNRYRYSGAGRYPMYRECPAVREINVEMAELIMDYFREFSVVELD